MSLFFSILGHITNRWRATPSNTLLEGLVAAWDMDEASGTVMVDSHTNSLDGTIYGATLNGSEYSFDRIDDYVEVPDNDLLSFSTTAGMSISVWINVTSIANGYQYIVSKNGEYKFMVYNAKLMGRIYDGTTAYHGSYTTNDILTLGWHHVVMTWDGLFSNSSAEGVNFSIDGTNVSATAQGSIITGVTNTTNIFRVGKDDASNTSAFQGEMKSLFIYNEKLTSEKITDLYNAGTPLTYDQASSGSAPLPPSGETFLTSADYYVSSSTGLDTNDGLTPETAWASLSKVSSSTFTAGQDIAFKAGDEWVGTLTVPSSGTAVNRIRFSAYGTGVKPKIYGSDVITGWTLHSGNIYKTTLTNDINQLFLNGERIQLARMPKTGYYDVTGVTNTTTFTSTELSGAINHVGANAIIKTNRWGLATKDVTVSSSQTLTISSAPAYTITVGDGFFMNNKLNYLTAAGEYYYDAVTNELYLWTPNGDSPANYVVRGSSVDNLIFLNNKDYVTIENLELLHSSGVSITTDFCDYLTIDKVDIKYPDSKGLYINHDTYGNYTNITVDGANHVGFHAQFTSYSNIIDNTITNVGVFDALGLTGMGGEQDGRGFANTAGTDNTIRYNKIENIAYSGLTWSTPNAIIDKNLIINTCLVKDDGGGIYTYSNNPLAVVSDGSQLTNNIIINSRGTTDGTNATYTTGYGIYLDNNVKNITVQNNTIKTSDAGMFINDGAGSHTVTGNTFMDGSYTFLTGILGSSCTITNNIFYTTDRLNSFIWWTNQPERLMRIRQSPSTLDYNTYVGHYSTTDLFSDGTQSVDWTGWKAYIGGEVNSTLDTTALGVGEVEEMFYNDSKIAKEFILIGTYRDLSGVAASNPLILQPFTSKILIKE